MSPDARLDLETGGEKYEVIVYAVDSGTPVKETATTTVTVNITDVNNKPPTFNESAYQVYVSERAAIGTSWWQTKLNSVVRKIIYSTNKYYLEKDCFQISFKYI